MMGEPNKKVAIIGCGVTGMAAIKCCLDEGLQPTCFERSDDVGGIWVYRDNKDSPKVASVYKSTITNVVKEMMCYSDFPFPKEWPNYLHNTYMKKYCDMYAEHFGLKEHVRFSTRVTRLEQAPDYDTTGRWIVTAKNDDADTRQEFDAVMICTGMFHNPFIPDFPGLYGFQGEVLHSHDYRRADGFEGKRVVVVGVGNSAGDAATDLSHHASQVYFSVRRGTWLSSRLGVFGIPYDLSLIRRYHNIPSVIFFKLFKKLLVQRYGFISASLKPSHDVSACEILVNDELSGCILNGSVIIRANIARFTKTGVEFEDGTYEEDVDAVIMATGYRFSFPFEADCPSLETKHNRVALYKLVFPLGLKHNTLSVNGAVKPLGAVIPCVELQARWAARIFKGLADLPSQSEMEAEVKMTDDIMETSFISTHRHIHVMQYADSIGSEIGVTPNFSKLFFTDPVLTLRCLFGPYLPYQYRLVGPGKWGGARKAINTVWERLLEPTKTRPVEAEEGSYCLGFLICGLSVFAAVAAVLFIY